MGTGKDVGRTKLDWVLIRGTGQYTPRSRICLGARGGRSRFPDRKERQENKGKDKTGTINRRKARNAGPIREDEQVGFYPAFGEPGDGPGKPVADGSDADRQEAGGFSVGCIPGG